VANPARFGARVLHVVLFQPQIPPNTGNVGRLCAVTGSRLHLVHPLGFRITDRHLKRSGMDYWHQLDVRHHVDWPAFRQASEGPRRLWLFTTRGKRELWDVAFAPEDGLVFGNEGEGAPVWLHDELGDHARVRIPQFHPLLRSLNLSTSVGIAVYEALRQLRPPAVPAGDRPGVACDAAGALKEL
jgi:tRNA (cytidine/uridine-2'-O-)-methyltransferase